MPNHISFPHIEQFRNAIFDVKQRATYVGRDADNEPIFDENLPLPTLTFTGTVKLHGTNASVAYNTRDGLWYQSRDSIITPDKDNMGFARFADSHQTAFLRLFRTLEADNLINMASDVSLVIYGEWAGKGVQSGVAVTQLPKTFYIFAAKAQWGDGDTAREIWLDSSKLSSVDDGILNVEDYARYSVEIDFANPKAVDEILTQLTDAVESECPISKALGVSGTGEGIVWKSHYRDKLFMFKIKGEKHKISGTKATVVIDPERQSSLREFITYAVTNNRFDQAVEKVFGAPEKADMRKLGDLIKWMQTDIQREEADVIKVSGLTAKEVSSAIAYTTKSRLEMLLAL